MSLRDNKNIVLFSASLIVILFVVISFSYVSKRREAKESVPADIKMIQTQSGSDDTASIEKDLNQTDLSGIDKELTDIEQELN